MVPEWHVSSIPHGYGSPMSFDSLPIISACIHSLQCDMKEASGLIVPEVRGNETVPEVVTTSGYALLHFFSDAAYNLTGFHIFYSMNSCPNNCSGHGKCTTGNSIASRVYCECDKYWKGEACDIPYCKNNCGSPDHGYCDLTGEKLCVCNDSWQGPDCSLSVPSTESYWVLPNVKPFSPSVSLIGQARQCDWRRLAHRAGSASDVYMYGGKMETSNGNVTDELWVFNIPSQTWSAKSPMVLVHGQQYGVEGHSAHIVELDSGDVIMILIFGYSAVYGYISNVQEYNLRTNTWLVPETKGAIVQGGYGHSSVYDGMTKCVYVHGGYKALPANKYGLVDDLYRYEVRTRTWRKNWNLGTNTWLVPETKGAIVQGGYGHSSVYDRMTKCVYVHGGYKALPANKYGLVDDLYRYEVRTRTCCLIHVQTSTHTHTHMHTHTPVSGEAQLMRCLGASLLFDVQRPGFPARLHDFLGTGAIETLACDEWKMLPKPSLHRDVNRFGHSAVISNGSMYVFGGFSGVLLNDILVYKLPNCEAFRAEEPCLDALIVVLQDGSLCRKDHSMLVSVVSFRRLPQHASVVTTSVLAQFCGSLTPVVQVFCVYLRVQHRFKRASMDDRCYRYTDCASCTANTNGCQWCEDKKCISASSNCTVSVKNYTKCHVRNEQICTKLTSCKSCSLNLNCQWDQRQQECHALPAHLCGEGWSHVGDACLRINASRDSYDNAKLYCYNLSGNLASLTTSKEVDFVLDELHKYTVQKISPWVGLRKINISYWGWEDMSPFTNTTMQWQPGEPNDSGFCAYLEKAEVAGLKANPCTAMADGLICEKPVVSPNQNARPCKTPCSLRTTCSNCTSQGMECMWCSSAKRCVDSNAYVISFPYGQCLEWQTGNCLREYSQQ
ncbi:UNVERIFIED_CONTAM: hypothetical protein FKN15_057392 [Acipenser sinensis]